MTALLEKTGVQVRLVVVGLVLALTGLVLSRLVARLALAPDSQQLWTAVSIAIAYAGGILLTAGVAAYIMVPALRGREEAARDYGTHKGVLGSLLLAILLTNLVAPPVFALTRYRIDSPQGFTLAALLTDGTLLLVLYLRWVRPGVITARAIRLDLHNLMERVVLGLLVTPLAMILVVAVNLALRGLGVPQTQLERLQWVQQATPQEFLAVFLAAAVVAPVAEETFFRGFVFRAYLQRKGPITAYLVSSAVFAVLHMNIQAFVSLFVLGLLLAALYHRTGSLVPGIIVHAANNGLVLLLLYFDRLMPSASLPAVAPT